MDITLIFLCLLVSVPLGHSQQELAEHREFQYNSVVDPSTGRYNFAYDTGHDNDIAHSLHMQYQDADGMVRGRYGYTDPRGNLRMVEYEAGPNGFVARGDVGPDQFPHGEAPVSPDNNNSPASLSPYPERSGNDFNLDPAPVQMAGWNPEANPMTNQPQSAGAYQSQGSGVETENPTSGRSGEAYSEVVQPVYGNVNVSSENALEIYGPALGFYPATYTRFSPTVGNNLVEADGLSSPPPDTDNPSRPDQENSGLNVGNIDVNPDDIRQAAGSTRTTETDRPALVRRSGYTGARYHPVRVVADHSYTPRRQTHDHDAETRSRQTHDHDAELRSRISHDHYREARHRASHDHASERYHNHDHDHAAERAAYYRRYGRYYPRRIFYRDSHSWEPHEHYDNPVYRNYRAHGHDHHSDTHLYGRYRNYVVPATERPRAVKYIPSDRYHDKEYYWTY